MKRAAKGPSDPLWYKDAVIYELRIRSYADSNGDGIGDFAGLESKLDYIQALGVNAIWLLPFYPSPQRDDGYDIADYTTVHPDCGTLEDARKLIREAHKRGIYIITELVLNHTSDQHEWFQRARRAAPGSSERNFYVWSDDPQKYRGARIIFSDFETSNWSWDPVAKSYYWHRFYSHQPDLNFDNPAVRKEVYRLVDYWLGLGVDGLRLDAVPYLYEREGTTCENLAETHAFLRELRSYVDQHYPNRMLLAEANQWPEDAAAYLGEGRECHMAFHFPIMPRMFMAIRMEDRFPLTDIWSQTPEIDPTCQWALFLRNHDELTLEMVTDEERDYMYRAYAHDARMRINLGIRRRLAPLLGNNRRSIELINGLLFSLPGTPVVYYGDEIGMGDNVYLGDRDGVRTPMQWSSDRNAGFSTANPQRLILPVVIDYEYHYQTVNVEAQEANRHSLLWWMRRLIALRRRFRAFGRGSMEFLTPENPHVLAFLRQLDDERVLVVANLSRFVQYVQLDLSRFKGQVPVELFSHSPFPPVTEAPYLLTLGPHGFIWFSLEAPSGTEAHPSAAEYELPTVNLSGLGDGLSHEHVRNALELLLPAYLPRCRWFRSKARAIGSVRIEDMLTLDDNLEVAFLNVTYPSGDAEMYVMPLSTAFGEAAQEARTKYASQVIAAVTRANHEQRSEGVLLDATVNPNFAEAVLETLQRNRRIKTQNREITPAQTNSFRRLTAMEGGAPEPHLLKAEQSNTTIVFGDRFLLKLFRKLEPGLNPEIEIGRFLTEHPHSGQVPALAGWLDYHAAQGDTRNLALVQEFVPNQSDAWQFTLAELGRFYESAATHSEPASVLDRPLTELSKDALPVIPQLADSMNVYLQSAQLMGERVAQLHLALSSDAADPGFAPEPFSLIYQRSRYQSMRNLMGQTLRLLNARLNTIPAEQREIAQQLLARRERLDAVFSAFLKHRFSIVRTRIHGDLHLGQMLFTGKDFVIIDFEGEPARALDERRRKRSPLQDVAGMLRSFDYAAIAGMREFLRHGALGKVTSATLEPWARLWKVYASSYFLRGYMQSSGDAPYLPKEASDLGILLDAFVLEKAVYELGYELNNRPDWTPIPLIAIAHLIHLDGAAPSG
jgi:maltose alpha-D-glucosyltransferase/alpha-amylase